MESSLIKLMKTRAILFPVAFISFVTVSVAQAQITSAGSYTRRIAPNRAPARPAPARAAAPAPAARAQARPAPAAAAQPATPPAVAATPAPVDPEKVKEGKDDVDRKRLEWQKKRAEEGSPYAQYDLGVRFLTGDGVEKDAETARKWLELASKNGNSSATKKLAELKEEQKKTEP